MQTRIGPVKVNQPLLEDEYLLFGVRMGKANDPDPTCRWFEMDQGRGTVSLAASGEYTLVVYLHRQLPGNRVDNDVILEQQVQVPDEGGGVEITVTAEMIEKFR